MTFSDLTVSRYVPIKTCSCTSLYLNIPRFWSFCTFNRLQNKTYPYMVGSKIYINLCYTQSQLGPLLCRDHWSVNKRPINFRVNSPCHSSSGLKVFIHQIFKQAVRNMSVLKGCPLGPVSFLACIP